MKWQNRISVTSCMFRWCQFGRMSSPSSRCPNDYRNNVRCWNLLRISHQSSRYRTQLRGYSYGSHKYGGYDSRIYRSSICWSANARKCKKIWIISMVWPYFFKLFSIQQTLGQWQIIFYTTAAVYIVEFIVYGMLASGEEQPWNRAFQQKGSDDAQKKLEGSTQEIK